MFTFLMCVSISRLDAVQHVCVPGSPGGRRTSCHVGARSKLAKAANALNPWAVSPAPLMNLKSLYLASLWSRKILSLAIISTPEWIWNFRIKLKKRWSPVHSVSPWWKSGYQTFRLLPKKRRSSRDGWKSRCMPEGCSVHLAAWVDWGPKVSCRALCCNVSDC